MSIKSRGIYSEMLKLFCEFTGYHDWLSLQKLNPKIVCLDDTQTMKTSKILAEVQEKNL